jgi:hypothetical protein
MHGEGIALLLVGCGIVWTCRTFALPLLPCPG